MRGKYGLNLGRHNPRLTMFSSVIRPGALPAPAKRTNWVSRVGHWDMLGNDAVGDCVFASTLDMVRGIYAATQREVPAYTKTDALALYHTVSGYDPSNPASDVGSDFDAVGDYWMHHPIGGMTLLSRLRIPTVDPVYLMLACDWLGLPTIGGGVPNDFEDQFAKGGVIDFNPKYPPNPQSGHQMLIGGHEDGMFRLITWGQERLVTPRWVSAVTAADVGGDAQVAITHGWIRENGLSPSMLHLETIERDADLLRRASA